MEEPWQAYRNIPLAHGASSDADVLCIIFRYGMREGWMSEEQIVHVVGAALRTRRKAR
jgi:hypothetical protein